MNFDKGTLLFGFLHLSLYFCTKLYSIFFSPLKSVHWCVSMMHIRLLFLCCRIKYFLREIHLYSIYNASKRVGWMLRGEILFWPRIKVPCFASTMPFLVMSYDKNPMLHSVGKSSKMSHFCMHLSATYSAKTDMLNFSAKIQILVNKRNSLHLQWDFLGDFQTYSISQC